VTTGSRTETAPTDANRTNGLQQHVGVTPRQQLRRFASIPAVWRFPLLVVLVVVVLGTLELSGSSASLYAEPNQDSGLVAGRARRGRVDEWWVRTPMLARQATLGLPEDNDVGVGEHDMGVVLYLPTRGWEVLARPSTLPYHLFGVERAFAFEWWIMMFGLPAIGLYTLAVVLGARAMTAALIAMIVVLSPAVQWWSVSVTGASIGYALLASAAFIAATRARSLYGGIGLAGLGGWLAACLVLLLYPPWIVPLALVGGVAGVAAIAASYPSPEFRREWWLRLFLIGGITAAVGGALVVGFFVAHRGGIEAVSNSLYPGRRRSPAGAGDFGILLGAPLDLIESTRSSREVAVNGLNQSEASAGLFTVFAVAAAMFTDPPRVPWKPWRKQIVLLGLLGISLVLVAWHLLPIPDIVGRITFLDRVRTGRLLLPLAVASALLLGLFLDRRHRSGRRLHPVALAAGALAFAVPTLWAGFGLRIDGELVSRWQVLLLTAIATAGVGLALWGARIGLWILVGLFAVTAATINPLQHGLDPLLDSPATRLGRELRARPGAGAVLNFWGGDITARGGLTASGVDLVSGVNLYPNEAAWRILDPGDAQRQAWDRWNNAVWEPAPPGSAPQIIGHEDTVAVTVDPCDPRLAKLGVGTVVSIQPLTYSCLVETDRVTSENGSALYAYRVRS
jgi:hypothetical protein